MIGKLKRLYSLLENDVSFFRLSLPFTIKVDFVIKKYYLILKNKVFRSNHYESRIFNKSIIFDNPFGIGFLQNVYIDNSFLKKYIPENSIIIDIGANIGQFNIFCTNYLHAKTIYSLEPIKKVYDKLILNVNKNNCYNYAISTEKKLKLYTPGTTLMSSSYKRNEEDLCEEVKTVKLDDLDKIKKEEKIDLLKIDTEGSEYDVLISSENTLKKTKYLLIETSVGRPSDGTIIDIISLLKCKLNNIRLVDIGYVYRLEQKVDSIDLLFQCQ